MVERCNQENWQDYEYKQCAGAMRMGIVVFGIAMFGVLIVSILLGVN